MHIFTIFFYSHIFSKNLNNITIITLQNRPLIFWEVLSKPHIKKAKINICRSQKSLKTTKMSHSTFIVQQESGPHGGLS